MQVVEVKPSNSLTFKIPNSLTSKFSIGNLTLRTVCIYVVSLHPNILSVSPQTMLIDAFQETQINVLLHWSQQINCLFKSKIRVYIWQLYDDQSLSAVVTKMFNQEADGSCLLFEQLTVDVDIDSKYLKRIGPILPSSYNISRVMLPNMSIVIMTEQMIHKVLSHCEKLGKVKAIYTFDSQYVIQFSHVDDVVGAFCQVRDQGEKMAIFGISCIPNLGSVVCSPDILILSNQQSISSKMSQKKQPVRSSFVKEIQPKKIEGKKEQIKKQIKQEQKQEVKKISKDIKQQIKQQPKEQRKEQRKESKKEQIRQQKKQQVNQSTQFQIAQVPEQKVQYQEKREVKKSRPQRKQKHHNPKQIFITHNPKDLVKQSFYPQAESFDTNKIASRKRTKSQEFQEEHEIIGYSSSTIDINQLSELRTCHDFQVRSKKHFQQKAVDVSKKILNMEISSNQIYIYLLLRDCVMVCHTQDISNKKVIKFDPIDSENIHLPTPMLLFNKEKTLIFANQSYIFWVCLTGQEQSDWKYVQRKQIYCIQVVEQLNLLMVGGKNFSKLAYLGKSTQRSNIKVYSCGKLGKRDHLFTYDIPNCNGQNIIELKYISTKPNNTKLLLAITHQQRIFFLRVRAYDHIEVYSVMETQQIGIQQVICLKYHFQSSILVCQQKLSQDAYCFKYLKINCSYEKVQISTQSVKLPVVKYNSGFRLGGKVGNQWLTCVDDNNVIYSYYLDWKQPQKTQYKSLLKDCILLSKGAIFRQITQIRSRIVKL